MKRHLIAALMFGLVLMAANGAKADSYEYKLDKIKSVKLRGDCAEFYELYRNYERDSASVLESAFLMGDLERARNEVDEERSNYGSHGSSKGFPQTGRHNFQRRLRDQPRCIP